MGVAVYSFLCALLIKFVGGMFTVLIDFFLISEALLPTDVFEGILDFNSEIFTAYLPYINWFIPLDYAVLLFGTFLDAYATYIIWKYFKKIIASVFGNSGSITKILSSFFV